MTDTAHHPSGIRDATPADAATIAAIYNHYVAQTVITFEEEPVPPAEMARRIAEVQAGSLPWLVVEGDDGVAGYAYASAFRTRSAYRFSAEVTIYLDPAAARRGIGTRLYDALLPLLPARGLHVAIAAIALPNAASIALHEKFGLRKVGHFPEVGFKLGRWVDVGYWQRTF